MDLSTSLEDVQELSLKLKDGVTFDHIGNSKNKTSLSDLFTKLKFILENSNEFDHRKLVLSLCIRVKKLLKKAYCAESQSLYRVILHLLEDNQLDDELTNLILLLHYDISRGCNEYNHVEDMKVFVQLIKRQNLPLECHKLLRGIGHHLSRLDKIESSSLYDAIMHALKINQDEEVKLIYLYFLNDFNRINNSYFVVDILTNMETQNYFNELILDRNYLNRRVAMQITELSFQDEYNFPCFTQCLQRSVMNFESNKYCNARQKPLNGIVDGRIFDFVLKNHIRYGHGNPKHSFISRIVQFVMRLPPLEYLQTAMVHFISHHCCNDVKVARFMDQFLFYTLSEMRRSSDFQSMLSTNNFVKTLLTTCSLASDPDERLLNPRVINDRQVILNTIYVMAK